MEENMKGFGKLLIGVLSIGAIVGGAYCYMKNKAKADAVSQAEIYRGVFAISVCNSAGLQSPTIAGAQAANELLNIRGVKASFVLTEYQGQVFVSARSIDEVNVQVIMEKMGGGGHLGTAGCQLSGVSLEDGKTMVRETLDRMIGEGDLVV